MRKLVESTFMTLDGVISDPQNWCMPYWDDDHAGYANTLMATADSLLCGRKTYEGFIQAWPSRSGDPYTDKINAMPKHVATRTLTDADLTWNASVLPGDDAAKAVHDVKQGEGGDILKFGTGELDRTLLENGLVDEYHLWVFPVFVGAGQRIFEGFDITHLTLVDTTTFASGIAVHTYAPKQG